MKKRHEVLFMQAVFPITYFASSMISFPYLSLLNPIIVFHEAVPFPYVDRIYYRLIYDYGELQIVVGLDINLFLLIGLISLIVLQMIIPWHPHPIFDLGGNLLLGAAVVLVWYRYLVSIVATIPIWEPQVISVIPLLGMALVPINRILIPYVVRPASQFEKEA